MRDFHLAAMCLVVLVSLCVTRTGHAQVPRSEPSAAELSEARTHHREALDALESGRLEAAEHGFRAALTLAPRASSAFNLALVLIDRLQFVEAIVLLRGLERGRYGEPPVPPEELSAHRRLAEEGVATLHLETGAPDPIEILVNERPSGSLSAGRDLRLRLDPGAYAMRGANARIIALNFQLEAGEQAHHLVSLAAPPSRSRRGLVIALVIVGVVVVAAATGLGVALARRGDEGGGLPVVHALTDDALR